MHFFLRAIPDNDLLAMRRQGRLIWERYLGTAQGAVDTIIASIRDRLGIPPLPAPQTPSISIFNETFVVCTDRYIKSTSRFVRVYDQENGTCAHKPRMHGPYILNQTFESIKISVQ